MYPYFNFNSAEEEEKWFPKVSLWEQACIGCCKNSINDFNVATMRYEELFNDMVEEIQISFLEEVY